MIIAKTSSDTESFVLLKVHGLKSTIHGTVQSCLDRLEHKGFRRDYRTRILTHRRTQSD